MKFSMTEIEFRKLYCNTPDYKTLWDRMQDFVHQEQDANHEKKIFDAIWSASNINPFGDVQNAEAQRKAREAMKVCTRPYNALRIAWELERTAMGDGYFGNALRVAKDMNGITDSDRSLLDRYATGLHHGTDHVALQALAMKIMKMEGN